MLRQLVVLAHARDGRVLLDEPLARLVALHAGGHLAGEPSRAQGVHPHTLAGPQAEPRVRLTTAPLLAQ